MWLAIFPLYIVVSAVQFILLTYMMALGGWALFFVTGYQANPLEFWQYAATDPSGLLPFAYRLFAVYVLFRYAYLSPSLWRPDSRWRLPPELN